ncbi:hypothetical protein INT47_011574 [Mucor saturninus]|uniref:Uncharacterized protein n=1 Tax=Mucor saturninus TaxID=64648 RepID=A0A8H7UZ39_9FUNG|nr:hypothetical protein INT47_011574 [Mucor saturninus]
MVLPIKSYFVLAQLNEEYIQLTLNQVVQTVTDEEDAASIIIQDEIISIPSIYDSLCDHIWKHIGNISALITPCEEHEEDNHVFKYFLSNEDYKSFKSHMKRHLIKKVVTPFDMKDKIQISDSCMCSVQLSTRDIIEIALKPLMRNIANTVSSSLVNKSMFGNYTTISYLFASVYFKYGPEFTLESILAEELKNSIELKEVGTQSYTMLNSFHHLLEVGQRPYSYTSFLMGRLHQVSNETYGFYVDTVYNPNATLYYKNDTANTIRNGHAAILLKRGQVIDSVGLKKIFYIKQAYVNTYGTGDIEIVFIRWRQVIEPKDTISLESHSYDMVKSVTVSYDSDDYEANLPLLITLRAKNYSSFLQFSAKLVGQDDTSKRQDFIDLGEPLTLARF